MSESRKESQLEETLVSMDMRLIYLEDLIQQMNLALLKKDKIIDLHKSKIEDLEERIKDLDERKANRQGDSLIDERPPHY